LAIFVQFIVLLSISLGILNIMPFPALDGGHIVFVIWEKLRRKEIKRETKERILRWGFGLLLLLVAIVTINDIIRSGAIDFIKGVFK
jgi:regulator of sigma E protease